MEKATDINTLTTVTNRADQNIIMLARLEAQVPIVFEQYGTNDSLEVFILELINKVPLEELRQNFSHFETWKLALTIAKFIKDISTLKQIETIIKQSIDDTSDDSTYLKSSSILEIHGHTYIKEKRSTKLLTNFVFEPEYMITRSTDTGGGGNINENLYCFRMIVKNENFATPQVSKIILQASDFDDLKSLQEATKKVGGRIISGSSPTIAEFGVYTLNKAFPITKYGSEVLGLDTIKGCKYFVTPDQVYNVMTGETVENIVFMPKHESNPTVDFKLTHLDYKPETWRNEIAPFFLRHIMKIQQQEVMLLTLGWLTAVPVEHVFRKQTGELAGFPHLMITGMNGGGKTMLATSLLPYLGYSKDTELLNFGGKVANIQSIDWSYNVVVAFDEYRPNEWAEGERKAVERLIRESYGRSEDRKSNTSYNVRKFVRKNPMMMLGQMTTSDDANSERIIQVYLDPNFMNKDTEESVLAKRFSREFQSQIDTNFWVGFSIWMLQQPEDYILKIYHEFKQEVVDIFPDMKDRLRCFCAIMMTGLHLFENLAIELNISMEEIGYDAADIMKIPTIIANNREATQGETVDILEEFLNDVVTYGITYGNTHGSLFGKGKAVQVFETMFKNKHVWGKNNEPALIEARKKIILIKIDNLITLLNKHLGKTYNDKLLNPVLKSYYVSGKENPNKALVLAPSGYRATGDLRYTAFDYEQLIERGFGKIIELVPRN